MAYKNPTKLTSRRQGEIIGQVFRLISCYSDFFPSRSRVYLKDVAAANNNLYWLEQDKTGEVTAIAMVESKYQFQTNGITIQSVGHILSKINNQIHNILTHLTGDYKESNLAIFCRPSIAKALDIENNFGFFELNAVQLLQLWPDLAGVVTDYFNTEETLAAGLSRRGYNLYIKLTENSLAELSGQLDKLVGLMQLKIPKFKI